MKLHIEHFAKIPEANITLDGLTVIAGANNTGKSTVGKVLYSFFRGQSNIDRRVRDERLKAIREALEDALFFEDLPENAAEEILAGTRTVQETLSEFWTTSDVSSDLEAELDDGPSPVLLSGDARDALTSKIEKQVERARMMPAKQVSWNIFRRVLECVFRGQYHPLDAGRHPAKICLDIKENRNEITFFHDHAELSCPTKLFAKARFISTPDVIGLLNVRDLDRNRKYANVLEKDVYELACELVAGWGGKSLIEEAGRREDMQGILDGIDKAIGGEFVQGADGAFGIREGDHAEATRVENLSMGMKSLALLRLMVLGGALGRQDVLILDEPEVHLHPAWQLAYAQCIVRLQQAYELTVLVTTHSPYFLKALEIYSRKENIADKTTFYFSRLDDRAGGCVFEDCHGDLNKIFQSLYEPYAELM